MLINEKVSVIVPVYNCKKFIRKCLCSVIKQSYSNIELIVIDDGSTDGSDKIIKNVINHKNDIIYIRQINSGVSIARNKGIQCATGKYLLFLDGDDYIGKDYILHLIKEAEKSQSELVIGGYLKVDSDENIIEKVVPNKYIPFEHEEWAYRITAVCSRMYKREVWDRYGIRYEEGVRGEDVPISLFFNRICKNISIVKEAEYFYVQHADSITHNFRGLRNIKLPYKTIELMLSKLENMSCTNSKDFFELGVMRFLTQCVFDIGRGASDEKLYELCTYVKVIMERYFPFYWKNKKAAVFSNLEIPLIHKLEVKIFMILVRLNLLYKAASLLNQYYKGEVK